MLLPKDGGGGGGEEAFIHLAEFISPGCTHRGDDSSPPLPLTSTTVSFALGGSFVPCELPRSAGGGWPGGKKPPIPPQGLDSL